jgi:2-keto-3-deoxy-L-rhamnonate aldolase
VRKELEKQGYKDYPLIAGTAVQSIEETLQHLKDSKDAGAQWGLCLAPGYFASAVSQDGIARWFEAVADRSSMPIMVYVSGQCSYWRLRIILITASALSWGVE